MIRKGRKIFYFLFSVKYSYEIVEITEKNAFEKLNLAPTKLRFAKWIQSFIYFSKKKKEKRNETHVRLTKYYSTNIIIIKAIFVTLKKIGYGQQQAGKNLLNWFSSIWLQSL